MKNKRSSIQEQLTGDSAGRPRRQQTKRLQGDLHLHPGAVPESSAAVPGSHLIAKRSSDKTKQFSNEFDVLYSRESSPCTGGVQCLTSSGHPSWGTLGKSDGYRALEQGRGEVRISLEAWQALFSRGR